MKKYNLIIILLWFALPLASQDIEITNIYLNKGKVEVSYNLKDERIDRAYTINLYTSKDNFIQPVELVNGHVGVDIKVGDKKTVIWDAKKELGDTFKGHVSLELKGNYYIPFITIEGISENSVFKRGEKQDLVWSGGRGDNILQIELFKDGSLIKSFEERPNTGQTVLQIPKGIPPGENYQLKISDKGNRDEVVFSEKFIVKRKFPLSYQIAAGAIAVAGIIFLVDALIPEPKYEIPLPDTPER